MRGIISGRWRGSLRGGLGRLARLAGSAGGATPKGPRGPGDPSIGRVAANPDSRSGGGGSGGSGNPLLSRASRSYPLPALETKRRAARQRSVESLGGQLQRRFRTCGQFWKRQGLTNLLSLSVLYKTEMKTFCGINPSNNSEMHGCWVAQATHDGPGNWHLVEMGLDRTAKCKSTTGVEV